MTIKSFSDYEPMIVRVIQRFWPTVHTSTIKDTDEYAECCLTFARCCRDYDPKLGAKFGTFLYVSCWNSLLVIGKKFRRHQKLKFMPMLDRWDKMGPTTPPPNRAIEIINHVLEVATPQDRKLLTAKMHRTSLREQSQEWGECHESTRKRLHRALARARVAAEAVM